MHYHGLLGHFVFGCHVNLFSRSYGLAVTPRVRFMNKQKQRNTDNESNEAPKVDNEQPSSSAFNIMMDSDAASDDDDLFTVKPRFNKKQKRFVLHFILFFCIELCFITFGLVMPTC
jgi:hypothetical protein